MKAREIIWIRGCRRIVDNEWLILTILLPTVILSGPILFTLLLIIPLLWVLRKIAYGHFVVSTPLDLAMVLFLLMVLISINVNFDKTFSLPKLSGIIFGVGIFYAAAAAASSSRKKMAIGVLFLIACGFVVGDVALLGAKWT